MKALIILIVLIFSITNIFADEFESDRRDKSTWSKALTIHYGDEKKAKYEYIKLKVEAYKATLQGSSVKQKRQVSTEKTKHGKAASQSESSYNQQASRANSPVAAFAHLEEEPANSHARPRNLRLPSSKEISFSFIAILGSYFVFIVGLGSTMESNILRLFQSLARR